MVAFFCGAAGAVLVLAAAAMGAAAGWMARGWGFMPAAAVGEDHDEKRRVLEEQRAFEDMLHYNPDTAYGMNGGYVGSAGGEAD